MLDLSESGSDILSLLPSSLSVVSEAVSLLSSSLSSSLSVGSGLASPRPSSVADAPPDDEAETCGASSQVVSGAAAESQWPCDAPPPTTTRTRGDAFADDAMPAGVIYIESIRTAKSNHRQEKELAVRREHSGDQLSCLA